MSTLYMTSLGQKSNGNTLFPEISHLLTFNLFRPSTTGLKKQWCPEVIELIEHMWAQEPQDRPTMTEVVETLEDLLAKY